MILTSSIIFGFVRLTLLGLFLFFLNKKILNYHYPKDLLNYVVNRWVRYASVLVILIFILTQINAYDLFTIVLLLVVFLLVYFFEIKSFKSLFKDLKNRLRIFLIFIIRNRETKGKIFKLNKTVKAKQDHIGSTNLIILAFISVGIIISRCLFFAKDIYLLSDLWAIDLKKVKGITANQWFTEDLTMSGEHALISFYGKVVGVSPEIALQSFGILETILIAIILFWFTAKMTKSKTIAPIVTTLFFAFSPLLLPRSIEILTQHKHVFLALSLALPMMVFTVLPKNLSVYNKKHFIYSIIIFTAIALIDLFTAVVLLSPFLVLAFFFYQKKYQRNYYFTLLAYFIALTLVISIYYLATLYYNINFRSFITSNLLAINLFTHLPDLILPYNELIKVYQAISFFSVVLMIFLIKQRQQWLNSLLFILYFNALLLINSLDFFWIDEDLIRLSLTVFIPVVIGIPFALISKIILQISKTQSQKFKSKYSYAVLAVFTILFFILKPIIHDGKDKTDSNRHSKLVLEAYEKISQNYLPFSYTVVNNHRNSVLSLNKHFYMPYSTFNDIYLGKDAVYHNNINDKLFFKQNPDKILTNSVFIFVHNLDDVNISKSVFYTNNEMNNVTKKLDILKSRGRKVNVIYNKETLKVLELVNKAKSSKINDLLF